MYNTNNMVYKIKSNAEPLRKMRNANYPFKQMKVLDSFDLPDVPHAIAAMMACYQQKKRGVIPNDWKFQRTNMSIQRIS